VFEWQDDEDVRVKALVDGLESKVKTKRTDYRTKQEAFEDAKIALTKAERALKTNKDDSKIDALLSAVTAAKGTFETKEIEKLDAENLFQKYEAEFEGQKKARDDVLKGRIAETRTKELD
jgi:hypothetical protein